MVNEVQPFRTAGRALLVAMAVAMMTLPAVSARSRHLDPFLDHVYDDWLASVWFLASDAERTAFAALDDDLSREWFIRQFWAARGESPSSGRTQRLARWRENSRDVERRFDRFDSAQARALMIAGKPPRVTRVECDDVARRIEIWSYDAWHMAHQTGDPATARPFMLLFFLTNRLDYGSYAHWSPVEGTRPLTLGGPGRADWTVEAFEARMKAAGCFRRRATAATLHHALRGALGPEALRRAMARDNLDPAWADATPQRRDALPAGPLEITYPGYYNDQRTILRGRILVPTDAIEHDAGDQLFGRVMIEGDIRRSGGAAGARPTVVDVFRVVHDVAGAAPADGMVPLSFYRRLRPGAYTLNVRVEDAFGLGLLRETRTLEVPRLDEPAEPPAGSRGFVSLTRESVSRLQTLPSVEVLSPGDDHLVGPVTISAVTTGGPIGHLAFWLDGAPLGEDREPPFTAPLDLGATPARHEVLAVAYDPAGRELARDVRWLNTSPRRFDVRLLEPLRDAPSDRVRVEVDVPAHETLDRLDIFVDQHKIASLHEAPWETALPRPLPTGTTFVRAVATLASGAVNEDLVFVGTHPAAELDVQLVELFTSVTDARGRTVTGLTTADLTVFEDGNPQPLVRFDTVSNLPISVALMMDVSASMRRKVKVAAASARRFFDTVLTNKDSASLVAFNDELETVVPFTADAQHLRFGTVGFRPAGTTRLHDGLILTVHSFSGRVGKRALVVLSDGQDVDSDFAFEQVHDFVLRSGVAVYPILLDLESDQTATDLERLATDTGGRFFAVRHLSELDSVYRQIEEDLRAQYLLVYAAPPAAGHEFRRVVVNVLRDGLTARTLHGYYP